MEITAADVAAARVELFKRGLCPLSERDIPAKLISVFEGRADIRFAYGGRGGAKSWSFSKMAATWVACLDFIGKTGVVLCIREFMNSLDDSSLQDLKNAILSDPWLTSVFDVGEKYIRTRSGRIKFIFSGTSVNLSSIKSKSKILLCLAEEAEYIRDEAWEKIIPTIREEGSELWAIWNPETKNSWVHKNLRLSKDPLVKGVEINWNDNPWFTSKMERDRLRAQENDPDNYDHIWEGAFKTLFKGAYYAKDVLAATKEGRIGSVPYDPDLKVNTAWDLGMGDSTAIWFWQAWGGEIRVIDFYESSGRSIEHYAQLLKDKGYDYGDDFVPHDARVRELGTGRTRVETMKSFGLRPRLVPMHKVMDGINSVRVLFPSIWFDKDKCEYGLDCLSQYRSDYDDKAQVLRDSPKHDWTSHAADAFRYLCMAYKEVAGEPISEPKPVIGVNDMTWNDLMNAQPRQGYERA